MPSENGALPLLLMRPVARLTRPCSTYFTALVRRVAGVSALLDQGPVDILTPCGDEASKVASMEHRQSLVQGSYIAFRLHGGGSEEELGEGQVPARCCRNLSRVLCRDRLVECAYHLRKGGRVRADAFWRYGLVVVEWGEVAI